MPAEDVHDKSPAETCKDRPCIVANLGTSFWCDKGGERVHVRFNGEFGERKSHTSEDVNDNLTIG